MFIVKCIMQFLRIFWFNYTFLICNFCVFSMQLNPVLNYDIFKRTTCVDCRLRENTNNTITHVQNIVYK